MNNIKNDKYYICKTIENINMIILYTKNKSYDDFVSDNVLVDATMFRLIQMVENINHISKEFKEIESRIKLYLPGDSIVGSLLCQPQITKIVKSNNFSVFEHDCNSWEVFGTMFVETKPSRGSKELKTRTINFLEEFDIDKRKEIIETIFLILEKNNIRYLEDFKKLNLDKLNKILNNIKNIDDKTKKLILNGIKNLLFNKKNVKIS